MNHREQAKGKAPTGARGFLHAAFGALLAPGLILAIAAPAPAAGLAALGLV